MKDALEMLGGLAAGALAGLAVGLAVSWGDVSAAFRGWPTCWQDCGPIVLVPLWIGAVVGAGATLEKGDITGLLLTVALGAAAGFFAGMVLWFSFGKTLAFTLIPLQVPHAVNLTHAFLGGAAGLVWHFLWHRLSI